MIAILHIGPLGGGSGEWPGDWRVKILLVEFAETGSMERRVKGVNVWGFKAD